jgi:hypothetical protein
MSDKTSFTSDKLAFVLPEPSDKVSNPAGHTVLVSIWSSDSLLFVIEGTILRMQGYSAHAAAVFGFKEFIRPTARAYENKINYGTA